MGWLPPKRGTPRRKAPERVQHVRIKPRAGAAPTPEEAAHMERVARMGCCVCGMPATVHHVTGYADRPGHILRSHQCVVPLCPKHHQIQHSVSESVEALNHRGFYRVHGIDLFKLGTDLWRQTCAPSSNT